MDYWNVFGEFLKTKSFAWIKLDLRGMHWWSCFDPCFLFWLFYNTFWRRVWKWLLIVRKSQHFVLLLLWSTNVLLRRRLVFFNQRETGSRCLIFGRTKSVWSIVFGWFNNSLLDYFRELWVIKFADLATSTPPLRWYWCCFEIEIDPLFCYTRSSNIIVRHRKRWFYHLEENASVHWVVLEQVFFGSRPFHSQWIRQL